MYKEIKRCVTSVEVFLVAMAVQRPEEEEEEDDRGFSSLCLFTCHAATRSDAEREGSASVDRPLLHSNNRALGNASFLFG